MNLETEPIDEPKPKAYFKFNREIGVTDLIAIGAILVVLITDHFDIRTLKQQHAEMSVNQKEFAANMAEVVKHNSETAAQVATMKALFEDQRGRPFRGPPPLN